VPLGERSNKTSIKAMLQESSTRNPVLHIASHFSFSPGIEKDSFLL
jgi:CHAT domain-containing protein